MMKFGLPEWVPDIADSTAPESNEEDYREAIRDFSRYFQKQFRATDDFREKIFKARENFVLGKECAVRFPLNLDELRASDVELTRKLLERPLTFMRAALEALRTNKQAASNKKI